MKIRLIYVYRFLFIENYTYCRLQINDRYYKAFQCPLVRITCNINERFVDAFLCSRFSY